VAGNDGDCARGSGCKDHEARDRGPHELRREALSRGGPGRRGATSAPDREEHRCDNAGCNQRAHSQCDESHFGKPGHFLDSGFAPAWRRRTAPSHFTGMGSQSVRISRLSRVNRASAACGGLKWCSGARGHGGRRKRCGANRGGADSLRQLPDPIPLTPDQHSFRRAACPRFRPSTAASNSSLGIPSGTASLA